MSLITETTTYICEVKMIMFCNHRQLLVISEVHKVLRLTPSSGRSYAAASVQDLWI